MICADCKYFSPAGRESPSQCRRNPPLVMVMPTEGLAPGQVKMRLQSYWPPIAAEAWCGEYVQKPIGAA